MLRWRRELRSRVAVDRLRRLAYACHAPICAQRRPCGADARGIPLPSSVFGGDSVGFAHGPRTFCRKRVGDRAAGGAVCDADSVRRHGARADATNGARGARGPACVHRAPPRIPQFSIARARGYFQKSLFPRALRSTDSPCSSTTDGRRAKWWNDNVPVSHTKAFCTASGIPPYSSNRRSTSSAPESFPSGRGHAAHGRRAPRTSS